MVIILGVIMTIERQIEEEAIEVQGGATKDVLTNNYSKPAAHSQVGGMPIALDKSNRIQVKHHSVIQRKHDAYHFKKLACDLH